MELHYFFVLGHLRNSQILFTGVPIMINKNEPILLSLVRFAKGQEQDNAFAESVFRILKKTSVIKFLNKKIIVTV